MLDQLSHLERTIANQLSVSRLCSVLHVSMLYELSLILEERFGEKNR